MKFKFGDKVVVNSSIAVEDGNVDFHEGLEGNIIDCRYVMLGVHTGINIGYRSYGVRLNTVQGFVDKEFHEEHLTEVSK